MLDLAELERRMRPAGWSDRGFLGASESLSDVLARDAATLSELGVTCDELAATLLLLIEAPEAGLLSLSSEQLVELGDLLPKWEEQAQTVRAKVVRRFGSLEHADGFSARVAGRYEIELTMYTGVQDCPWSERGESGSTCCGVASTDWRIRDTTRDLELSGPTLITHLIREHSFFEGVESPYRVEPRALAELLELGPFAPA